jgi:hypothetical protein
MSWGSTLAASVVTIGIVWGDASGACAGIGCGFGWIEVVRAMGWLPVVVGGSTGAEGAASTGACGSTGSAGAAGSAGALGSVGAEGGVGAGGVEDASTVVWW